MGAGRIYLEALNRRGLAVVQGGLSSAAPLPPGAMRLTALEPFYVRYVREPGRTLHRVVGSLSEAQGIRFLCPKCFKANGGPRGTHHIACWSRSRGTPDDAEPGPGRWRLDGSCLADLSLNAEAPGGARSVQLNGGCAWHGFVTDGVVTTC